MADKDIEAGDAEILGGAFTGSFTHALDFKKRLAIPAEWRKIVGPSRRLFVIPNLNVRCLSVFPAREMADFMERIRKIAFSDAEGRQVARIIASRSQVVEWDAQGRIRVRDELIEYAGLKEQVFMAGNFNGFELWSPETWAENETTFGDEALKVWSRNTGL